jgi:hypothetical protein
MRHFVFRHLQGVFVDTFEVLGLPEYLLRAALIVLVAWCIGGCSMSADTALAEKQVPQFHALLDEGRTAEIYAQASEDLKNAASEADFVALLDAVHRKLGTVQKSERQTWNVNYHTSGTFATLVYKTQYAGGEAAETFVYRIENDTALLVDYHINSNALITK